MARNNGPTTTTRGRGRPKLPHPKEYDKAIAFRFPQHLLERLDRYCQILMQEQPGMVVSRSEVVRMVLEKELEHNGLPQPGTRRRRKAAPQG